MVDFAQLGVPNDLRTVMGVEVDGEGYRGECRGLT